MKRGLVAVLNASCMTLVVFTALVAPQAEIGVKTTQAPQWFTIEGLVQNRLNLTYAELRGFPMISEVAMLRCVGGGQGGVAITYNWTGVPLFLLLSMAKVMSGAYREVIFNATDGFSSSVTLETAMEPTTILALEANGTDLESVEGFGSGYRVVLPCRWGYKWVKWIKQIVVVDYDYRGSYESNGLSDEAIRPNSTMPVTNPPIHNFTVTYQDGYAVRVLTNSTIDSFSYEAQKRLTFNIAGHGGTVGYFYATFSKGLLTSPYEVLIDQHPVQFLQTTTSANDYLYFTYSHSSHTVEIRGTVPTFDGGGGYPSRRLLL